MIDLHSHILPGIDDGAATLEESLEMARAAVADGVTALAATPHVRGDYPTRPEEMERLTAQVRDAVRREGIALELLTGGEVALDVLPGLDDEALRRFGLGGSRAHLLVEFPYAGWPLSLEFVTRGLVGRGITPVIAHPERNAEAQRAPERLAAVVDAGALLQLTAASLDGRLGRSARRAAHALLELGLAHLLAGDAHSAGDGRGGLGAAAAAVGDTGLAHWLTVEVPGAIVSGDEIPRREAPRRRRRLRPRRK